jgi:hypothetical protein
MAIVVVSGFDSYFSVQQQRLAHYVEPFSARAGKQLKTRVKDIERQDSVRLQMSPHRGKEGRKLILRAQVKKGVPSNEYQREPPPKLESPHVSLNEFDSCTRSGCTSVCCHQHLRGLIESNTWHTRGGNWHDQLTTAASELEDGARALPGKAQIVVRLGW